MLTINGIQIDFDITSPMDVKRYHQAMMNFKNKDEAIAAPVVSQDDPEFWIQYMNMLNEQLQAFGNFLDDTFEDGIAEKLLTNNPSLTKVYDVVDALNEAMESHGKEFELKINKYQPNRAARRAQ